MRESEGGGVAESGEIRILRCGGNKGVPQRRRLVHQTFHLGRHATAPPGEQPPHVYNFLAGTDRRLLYLFDILRELYVRVLDMENLRSARVENVINIVCSAV